MTWPWHDAGEKKRPEHGDCSGSDYPADYHVSDEHHSFLLRLRCARLGRLKLRVFLRFFLVEVRRKTLPFSITRYRTDRSLRLGARCRRLDNQ